MPEESKPVVAATASASGNTSAKRDKLRNLLDDGNPDKAKESPEQE